MQKDAEFDNLEKPNTHGERRAMLRAHLARLSRSVASMRGMDERMHDAFEGGKTTSDPGARARHALLLDEVVMAVTMLQEDLEDSPPSRAPAECRRTARGGEGYPTARAVE